MTITTFFIVIAVLCSDAYAQQNFVAPDESMTPVLSRSETYEVDAATPALPPRAIAVFSQDGISTARQVVGMPYSKVLSQDPYFVMRASSEWSFHSGLESVVCFMRGEHPTTTPVYYRDLVSSDILLQVPLASYEAAPALGDSLYYVHALNRPVLPSFQTSPRSLAQGADSREFGLVHARDVIGIIDLSE